ncbi:putative membrane protein [Neolecta irregularis DAH-3]|uniref:Putative membrane protein n=1 Tax=Neolecta irregularis (strain DAH-3) TaxID=1198029 RepID=A0A1U7LM96_NEOID|nr:putative membrane protein [Neolecta irregularis DAH-3]|eukprot:OLL23790.1 putative membrane protein [Neolecta irregularis DAH-3]
MSTQILDKLYLWFFILHIPATIFVDLGQFLPRSVLPGWVFIPLDFYVSTFDDPLFTRDRGGWLLSFFFLEIVIQLPVFVYGIQSLKKAGIGLSRQSMLVLLVYAVQSTTTTFGCVAELLAFEASATVIVGFYMPFLFATLVMAVDMFQRLNGK